MFVTTHRNWPPIGVRCLGAGLIWLSLAIPSLVTAEENLASGEQISVDSNAENWPTARGDAQSTGHARQTLPEDLQVVWEYKADEAIETTPVVVGKRVFVSDVMGTVYAVDRGTGKEIWKVDFDTGFLASPAVQSDHVVIGDIDGNLYNLYNAVTQHLTDEVEGSRFEYANRISSNVLKNFQAASLNPKRLKTLTAVPENSQVVVTE